MYFALKGRASLTFFHLKKGKIKLSLPHPLRAMLCHSLNYLLETTNTPTLHGGEGAWIVLFSEVTSFHFVTDCSCTVVLLKLRKAKYVCFLTELSSQYHWLSLWDLFRWILWWCYWWNPWRLQEMPLWESKNYNVSILCFIYKLQFHTCWVIASDISALVCTSCSIHQTVISINH